MLNMLPLMLISQLVRKPLHCFRVILTPLLESSTRPYLKRLQGFSKSSVSVELSSKA